MDLLLSNAHQVSVRAGEGIIQQGDIPSFLYLVLEGQIKTLRIGTAGEEVAIRLLMPGATFMDAVIFMGATSPISACAMEKSKLLKIPAETVKKLALQDPTFACNLLRIVTSYYKTALQQIDSIATKTPTDRLGYYLLKYHLEQGGDSTQIKLPFQKSVIANHLGMTPETFSRALNQIKNLGIAVDHGTLVMSNPTLLCHFCDQDMASLCPRAGTDSCPADCLVRAKTGH